MKNLTFKKLDSGSYSVLDNTIAIGKVYKLERAYWQFHSDAVWSVDDLQIIINFMRDL